MFVPLVVSCTKEDNSLTFFEKHSNEIWVMESSEIFDADDIGKGYLTFPSGFILKLQYPEIEICTYVQEGIYEEIYEGMTEKSSTVITKNSANKLIYSTITSGFNNNPKYSTKGSSQNHCWFWNGSNKAPNGSTKDSSRSHC